MCAPFSSSRMRGAPAAREAKNVGEVSEDEPRLVVTGKGTHFGGVEKEPGRRGRAGGGGGHGNDPLKALALTRIDPFLLTKADPLGGLGECPLQAWWSLRRQGKYPGR